MVATEAQEALAGNFQNLLSYMAAGSLMSQHETNGGFKYMSGKGFNLDGYNLIAGLNNFTGEPGTGEGEPKLDELSSFGDKIILTLNAS